MGSTDDRRLFEALFAGKTTVEVMSINRVAEWFKSSGKVRLRLPPIQRSLVWRNEQIVNYWDSLLRGYPAGMMMVTRVPDQETQALGRDADNKTVGLNTGDLQLFDGQQRLAAILLGLGEGPLKHSLQLWVDIAQPEVSGDRLFELRINSTGQPFGYRPAAPNEKLRLEERRDALKDWAGREIPPKKITSPEIIFKEMATYKGWNPGLAQMDTKRELGSGHYTVPLSFLITRLIIVGEQKAAEEVRALAEDPEGKHVTINVDDLMRRLRKALEADVVLKLIDGEILKGDNFSRFFARLGQGGTRLSDEELIYSIIKDRYPKVHDRLQEIAQGPGRFASEVDLVLAGLRVAQAVAPWPGAEEWDIAARPTPDRLRILYTVGSQTTEPYFRSILLEGEGRKGRFLSAICNLRDALLYHPDDNKSGLPSILLARLPRDLLDSVLLFAFKRGEKQSWTGQDRATLIAFVLYWLSFVGYDDKASYTTFRESREKAWKFDHESIGALVRLIESEGSAHRAPRPEEWCALEYQVQHYNHNVPAWVERFSVGDTADGPNGGGALRVLATNKEHQKRALMWLQRHYIVQVFPDYDPTSTRDDDLPFDLDHAIPYAQYGEHWTGAQARFRIADPKEKARFQNLRHDVGGSLGNLRWLAASDNRQRGRGPIEDSATSLGDDIVRCTWNALLPKKTPGKALPPPKAWEEADVATFQRLIDTRTLFLSRKLMDDSGITGLLSAVPKTKTEG